ncbi:MAG: hypothetical protein KJZ91_04145 [Myxococcales bacterium]|nr:hypothetical protein [Myxococcales bacterium]
MDHVSCTHRMARQGLALALPAIMVVAGAPAADPASGPAAPVGLRADAEVDPTAYALGGYSLHVGAGAGRLRVDLGAFALDVPGFIHGNDGFAAAFHGYGAKLQAFASPQQRGGFVGVGLGLVRFTVTRDGTQLAHDAREVSVDVHAGWRLDLPARFYATAWLAVGRSLGAGDVTLDGATFARSPWMVFPALHVGHRFR